MGDITKPPMSFVTYSLDLNLVDLLAYFDLHGSTFFSCCSWVFSLSYGALGWQSTVLWSAFLTKGILRGIKGLLPSFVGAEGPSPLLAWPVKRDSTISVSFPTHLSCNSSWGHFHAGLALDQPQASCGNGLTPCRCWQCGMHLMSWIPSKGHPTAILASLPAHTDSLWAPWCSYLKFWLPFKAPSLEDFASDGEFGSPPEVVDGKGPWHWCAVLL